MSATVAVALVTAIGSLVVAAFSAIWSWKQNANLERLKRQLGLEERQEERRWAAQRALDRYREPLLEAAEQLGARIDNIQHGGFLSYVGEDKPQSETAILSTLYRFARYLGTLEILYSEMNFLKFEQANETKAVADLLGDIGRTMASDRFDRSAGFETSRFMIWREEQRAIGEVSIERRANGVLRCIGYAAFAEKFGEHHARWFAKIVSDLESGAAVKSKRLACLRSRLAALVDQLDHEKRYTDSDWIRRAKALREPYTASTAPSTS